MEICNLYSGCIFFNDKMANMPSATKLLKDRYCHKCYSDCARFRVAEALGRANVPADMYPDQIDKAADMISKK